jgi:hypothetical protein
LFDLNIIISGIPLLFLYIFLVWGILIIFIGLITRKRSKKLFRNFSGRSE